MPRASSTIAHRLSARLGLSVRAQLTDNLSTMVSFSRRGNLCRLRLHHMFRRAPEPIVCALAEYVRTDDRGASTTLDRFIEANRGRIRRLPAAERQRRLRLQSRGHVHDLAKLLHEVRISTGTGGRPVAIAWAPAMRVRQPRRSIKLGSYSVDAELIRIHPALDQPFVPAYFVRWIVHHELLHHRFRRALRSGAAERHPPLFRALERAFPKAAAAAAWEQANLDRLLAWSPGGTAGAVFDHHLPVVTPILQGNR